MSVKIPNVVAHCRFMEELLIEDLRDSEMGYFLAVFQTGIDFVLSSSQHMD